MDGIVCSCGFMNRSENRFCTQCGNKLNRKDAEGPRFVLLHGDKPNTIFSLNSSENFIGRGNKNTIVLKDAQVSKQHAIIYAKNGEFWIEDSKSKNGVYINGRRIKHSERLLNGSLVKLGTTILRFEMLSKS